jgi:uncharacterized protein (TIGR00251 family)
MMFMASFYRISGNNIYIDIKAIPGASKSGIVDVKEGRLRVRIAAAPEKGKANSELCSILAKAFKLPKKEVILESGEKSRLKTMKIPAGALEFLKEKEAENG